VLERDNRGCRRAERGNHVREPQVRRRGKCVILKEIQENTSLYCFPRASGGDGPIDFILMTCSPWVAGPIP
jgi:hypothetical protein